MNASPLRVFRASSVSNLTSTSPRELGTPKQTSMESPLTVQSIPGTPLKMASERMILNSDNSDLEIDESTSATQFVQARSASFDNPRAPQAATINVYEEFSRGVEGFSSFSPLVSRNIEHVATPISMSAEGFDRLIQGSGNQWTGIPNVDGAPMASSSSTRLKMPSRSTLKRAKTTGEADWNDEYDGDYDGDHQMLQAKLKRRKTVEPISDGNMLDRSSPKENVSPALDKESTHQQDGGQGLESEPTSVPSLGHSLPKANDSSSSGGQPYEERSEYQRINMNDSPLNDTVTPLLRNKHTCDRSKSAQETPVSQGDTELMSSETFAKAKRALTMDFPLKYSQASNDSTDELALPAVAPSTNASNGKITPATERTVSFEQPVPLASESAADHTTSPDYNFIDQLQHTYERPAWNLSLPDPANGSMEHNSMQESRSEELPRQRSNDGDTVMMEAVEESKAPVQADEALRESANYEQQPTYEEQTSNPAKKVLPANEAENLQENPKSLNEAANGPSKIAVPVELTSDVDKGNPKDRDEPRSDELSNSKRKSSAKVRIATPEYHHEPDIESLIGLPKEMYKPRPSRSRSRTFEEYMGFDLPDGDEGLGNDEPSKREERSEKPNKPSKKVEVEGSHNPSKSRKKKVKRGKTTSAAIGKSREPGIDDDVIWIDDGDDADGPAALARTENKKSSLPSLVNRARTPPEAMINEPSPPRSTSKFAVVITTPRKQQLVGNDMSKGMAQQEVPDPVSPTRRKSRSRKNTKKSEPKEERQESNGKVKNTRKKTKDMVAGVAQADKPVTVTPEPVSAEMTDDQPIEEVSEAKIKKSGECEAKIPQTVAQSSKSEPDTELNKDIESILKSPKSAKDEGLTPTPGLFLETPKKSEVKVSPNSVNKGPDKHSPIPINKRVPYRVGLSRKVRVAPLLKVIRK